MVLAAVLAGAAVVAVGVWVSRSDGDSGLTSQRQIDEVQGLISDDSYFAAFEAAELLDASTAGGPAMSDLRPQISAVGSLITDPPGAEVFYRAYSNPNAQWRRLGEAPLEGIRLPRGFLSLRIERNGFVSRQLAALNPDPLGNFLRETPVPVALAEGGTIPERMVSVPSRSVREIAQGMITGNDPVAPIPLGEFLIDQYEVTNREFKQFVDGGGYGNPDLWADEFRLDGLVLTRDEAMADLVDATGRPGPSTWELGTYPTGEDDHPVTGVSWYEAAAYARFVGKSLPTIYHWATASGRRYSSFIVAQSNFGGEGPVPVGQLPSLGPFGTYDMAGNVREWCLNTSREDRWILGGAWNDPSYLFTYANVQSPFDRSAVNGFRLVEYEGAGPPSADAARDIELSRRDYYSEAPVSDEVFAVYQDQFLYDPADLEAVIDEVVEDAGGWTRETVSFNAAYDGERVSAHLYLPAGLTPPYQTVIVFPGSSAIFAPSSRVAGLPFYDFLVRSGRAVLFPVYKGTFERNDGLDSTWPNGSVRYADYLVKWVQDLSRSIDYLETRDDIDAEQLAYFGLSWGGRMGAIVPAVEPRLKTAVLYLAGLAAGNSRPEVDQLNYVTRVTIPVLMLNGEHDAIEPLETSQLPMYELLGTPDADKRHRTYDSDHSIPRNAGIRETLDWLDKYLGPIN